MNVKNKKLKNYKDKLRWDITYDAACNKLETTVDDTYIWFNDYDCSKSCYRVKVDWYVMKNGWYFSKLSENMGDAKAGDIIAVLAAEINLGYYNKIHTGNYSKYKLPKVNDFIAPHACFNYTLLYSA